MNDFADWLSPIVVKELRQGMRSRAFVGIFLLLQAFMIFCVLTMLAEDNRQGSTAFFWMVLGATLLCLMPFRGLAALNGEIKGNTMELLLLTQLSSWRIAAGKWAALFLQSVLLVCAVLPYVILRYFLGGVDLVTEMTTLGSLLFGCGLFTAVMIGLSPYIQTAIGRGVLIFGLLFLINIVPAVVIGTGFVRKTTIAPAPLLLAALFLGPLAVAQCLELAVGKIAPLGENHAARKRLLVPAICLVCAILGWAFNEAGFFTVLGLILIAPICFNALVEETPPVPSLYRPIWPFRRASRSARIVGKFLHPGSASGLLFNLTIFGVVFLMLTLGSRYRFDDARTNYALVAGFGAIVMPLALARLLPRRVPAFAGYLGFQVLFFILAILLSASLSSETAMWPASLIPTTGFFLQLWDGAQFDKTASVNLLLTAWVAGVSLLALMVYSARQWKMVAALERRAEEFQHSRPAPDGSGETAR